LSIVKTFHPQIREVAGQERTLRFVISTGGVDRDNDTIAVDGWRLDNFEKNPVVLFAHNYRALPIARATRVWTEGDRLCAEAQFTGKDEYEFGYACYRLLVAGYLNATSVGFRPIKYARNEARGTWAIDYLEQELLEFSVVPIPANADALQIARGKGIDVGPYLREMRGGVLVPGASDDMTLAEFCRAFPARLRAELDLPAEPRPRRPTPEELRAAGRAVADQVVGPVIDDLIRRRRGRLD
jgi:HK97 family phage prohead protease